jgi:serine/threonine protein kinase
MYSFGCVLYEMLAGRRVFDYPSPADCAIAHLTEQPKPPVVRGDVLEGPLVDFIMQCLEKKARVDRRMRARRSGAAGLSRAAGSELSGQRRRRCNGGSDGQWRPSSCRDDARVHCPDGRAARRACSTSGSGGSTRRSERRGPGRARVRSSA